MNEEAGAAAVGELVVVLKDVAKNSTAVELGGTAPVGVESILDVVAEGTNVNEKPGTDGVEEKTTLLVCVAEESILAKCSELLSV